MTAISYDEQQIMSIYNAGTRSGTIEALREMRGYLTPDERELRELTDSTLKKLKEMADDEFAALDLAPDFSGDPDGSDGPM